MRTQPEIQDSPNAKILTDVKGDIRFEDVSFSYNDGTKVLDHVNLRIAPGETVSLVGSSGGGKTTMCHLIPRFYDVTGGRVTVDGNDVRDLTSALSSRTFSYSQIPSWKTSATAVLTRRTAK